MRSLLTFATAVFIAGLVVLVYLVLSAGAVWEGWAARGTAPAVVFPWGLGCCVGTATWLVQGRRGHWSDGVLAVAVTLSALLLGRSAAVNRLADRAVERSKRADVEDAATGDDVILELCAKIARDWSDEGYDVRSPRGIELTLARRSSYSPAVWDAAVADFDQMADEVKLSIRDERRERRNLARSTGELKARIVDGRMAPGGADIVFAALEALAAAFLGAGAFGRRYDDRPNSEQIAETQRSRR